MDQIKTFIQDDNASDMGDLEKPTVNHMDWWNRSAEVIADAITCSL